MTWVILGDMEYIQDDEQFQVPELSGISEDFVEDCKTMKMHDLFFKHVFPDITGSSPPFFVAVVVLMISLKLTARTF